LRTRVGQRLATLVILVVAWWVILTVTPILWADDGSDVECGGWWVEDYSWDPGFDDLEYCEEEVKGFTDTLKNDEGWTRNYLKGDFDAWEAHFEKSGVGGNDTTYVDSCDFAYFAGHGDYSGFYFGCTHDGDSNHPHAVHHSEADWGDTDTEWIVISACSVLWNGDQDLFNRFGNAFHGLHMICGFATDCVDSDIGGTSPGKRFVQYMTGDYGGGTKWSIRLAWFLMTGDWQPDDVTAALLYNEDNDVDKLPGCGDPGDDEYPATLVWETCEC